MASEDEIVTSSNLDSSLEGAPAGPEAPLQQSPSSMFKFNNRLYIVLIVLAVLLLAGGVAYSVFKTTKQSSNKTIVINTQSLSNGTLNKVTSSLGNTGKVNTQLTITPNTLFKNDVEIQGKTSTDSDLQVGGNLTVGGTLSVKGSSNFGANLSVAGQITAASLSVGSLSIGTINLSGDFNLTGHIIPSGTAPSVSANVAAAGGTATISGNDTAGTVTINIGSGKANGGELAIVTFHKPFATTPKVEITPVNAQSAQLFYFVSQSPTFFSIECAATPANGASYTFNYFVTQ
jgi:hypothetical protein